MFWSHRKCSWKSGKESCAEAFATNIGFYSAVSEVHCKYQGLYLVQNEGAAEMGESRWVVCVGEGWGAEGDRENLAW